MTITPGRWKEDEGLWAWSTFLRAHAAVVRRIEHDLSQRAGMPLGWYDVLLELSAAPGRRLRMQDLGEVAVLSRTRVSRIVDDLVARGYAVREPHPRDRRSAFAVITPEGRKALTKAAPLYLEAVRRHFGSRLSAAQVSAVRQAMERLLATEDRGGRGGGP